MRKAHLAAVLLMLSTLACGDKGTDPSGVPSPAPSLQPTPPPTTIVFAIDAVQDGRHGTVSVEAGSYWKLNSTDTQCYLGDSVVPCSGIQGWGYTQAQIGGFEGNCSPLGPLHGESVVWNCRHESRGATFEVCPFDSSGQRIGECKDWIMEVR